MLECSYFASGACRSCSWIEEEYDAQLARKQELVASHLPELTWLAPERSPVAGFRNKAKMVVAGVRGAPTLGILGPSGTGVDLQGCGLHTPGLQRFLPQLSAFVAEAGLTPYSVPERSGELKHVIVTESPDGELMVRFVLRSRAELPLVERFPLDAAVVSVNLQPEHKAILEGPEEITLRGSTLTMRVNEIPLHLRPQSFFQTNTAVASALYRHAQALVSSVEPVSLWDLYCGVGGFALHLAAPGRSVVGVEVSEQAIEAAQQTAREIGVEARFVAGDAAAFAMSSDSAPELVVVNPPRRGIGDLASWLDASAVRHVLYSSCNAESLGRDLARMPSFRPVSARLLDMFPNTPHHEVLVLLSR